MYFAFPTDHWYLSSYLKIIFCNISIFLLQPRHIKCLYPNITLEGIWKQFDSICQNVLNISIPWKLLKGHIGYCMMNFFYTICTKNVYYHNYNIIILSFLPVPCCMLISIYPRTRWFWWIISHISIAQVSKYIYQF